MSTELRTLVLNYLLADVQLRQLHADDAFAAALASVATDLRNLLVGKSPAFPIDWSQAPKWANWSAMDKDGGCFWYERRPSQGPATWVPGGGFTAFATAERWCESLQQRPEVGQ